MPWESDDLIASVRRRAQIPDVEADGAISDLDILDIANDEIALHMVPLVRSARGDYFVESLDTTIVANTSKYRLPENAQGSALRDVTIVDSAGDEYSIPRISMEDAPAAERHSATLAFVMEGPYLRLVPTPTSAIGTLRMYYERSHSQLIPKSGAITLTLTAPGVAAYDDAETFVASTTDSTTYAPYVGMPCDIVRAYPPFVADYSYLIIESITPDGSGNDVVTFTGPWPGTDTVSSFEEVTRAAYMTWFGVSPVVRLPRECWPLLVSLVTARVLEVIGDRDAAQMNYALFDREKDNVIKLLTPRVEGARKKIVSHWSPLRSRRRW